MLSVDEAFACLREHVRPLPVEEVALEGACGLQLARAICSQDDSPPFDKSMVDGYAFSTHDTAPTLRVIEQVTAGQVPHHAVEPGTTIRVMTGAPLPDGADAVVKWEDAQRLDDATIRSPQVIATEHATARRNESGVPIESGYCVLPRGAAFQTGQQVLSSGRHLRPVDIGLLAEIGRFQVPVIPRPRVAVLPTGNELVEGEGPLAAGQIRNSNGPMLLAALRQLGMITIDLGIGRDNLEDLRTRIEMGLDADVLLISGGVSAGVLDLVPDVLESLGVRQVLHKVKMKPGKPLWFGVRDSGPRRVLVFGLPGNPVSTFVAFHLFVRPALGTLAGAPFAAPTPRVGQLLGPVEHRGKRPSYHPCRVSGERRAESRERKREGGEKLAVEPLAWQSSADLATLARADGLALLPAGNYQLEAGQKVDVLPL